MNADTVHSLAVIPVNKALQEEGGFLQYGPMAMKASDMVIFLPKI